MLDAIPVTSPNEQCQRTAGNQSTDPQQVTETHSSF